jgi:hypothetical protein
LTITARSRGIHRDMRYRAYQIDLEEEEAGQWVARIRRIDGKPISTAPYGPKELPVLITMRFSDQQYALNEAKSLINRRRLK